MAIAMIVNLVGSEQRQPFKSQNLNPRRQMMKEVVEDFERLSDFVSFPLCSFASDSLVLLAGPASSLAIVPLGFPVHIPIRIPLLTSYPIIIPTVRIRIRIPIPTPLPLPFHQNSPHPHLQPPYPLPKQIPREPRVPETSKGSTSQTHQPFDRNGP